MTDTMITTAAQRVSSAQTEVVVIGAGAAGLACAAALTAAGRSVLVLEAAARVGGRIRSERGASGAVWELGAQVVHDRANPVWQHCPVGPLDPFSASDFRVVLGGRRLPMFALATVDVPPWQVMSRLAAGTTGSPADWLAGRPARTAAICRQWLAHDWAADPAVLDVAEMLDIGAAAGAVGDEGVVRGGFGGLIDALATGVPIRCSSPVHRLHTTADGVVAHTPAGLVQAAAAVVTVPPWTVDAVDADDADDAGGPARGPGGLHIDGLPGGKRAAAAGLRGGDAVVVVLRTSAVAPATTSVFEADSGLGFLRAQAGAGEVQIVAKGPAAQLLRKILPESGAPGGELPPAVLAAVTTAMPWVAGADLGPVSLADWGAEPFVRGAFTSPTRGRARHSAAWALPMAGRIFFAGESCSGARGVGRVHGALATGRRAAREYLATAVGRPAAASRPSARTALTARPALPA